MKIKKTSRGFDFIEFTDSNGEECSLQISSSIEPHVWLGCKNNTEPHHVTMEKLSPRMHLNQKQVRALVKHLSKWISKGRL